MSIESPIILILMGYALGLTFALLLVMSRHQIQPPTVVVQQAPMERDSHGCGGLLLFPILMVFAILFVTLFG